VLGVQREFFSHINAVRRGLSAFPGYLNKYKLYPFKDGEQTIFQLKRPTTAIEAFLRAQELLRKLQRSHTDLSFRLPYTAIVASAPPAGNV
jgi:hypothetical protein